MVIGIIAALLVALIPAVSSLTKSNGRKAAVSSLVGAVEQARAQALKSGESAYIIFPTFSGGAAQSTLERYQHKAYAIFAADPGNTAAPKQITTWKTLPTGVSIRQPSLAALPLASVLSPALTVAFSPDKNANPDFRCIQFNSTGGIEMPASDVTLVVFEGFVNGASEIITSKKDASNNPVAIESLKISHLTGRANYLNP